MLELFVIPQLQQDTEKADILSQEDSTLPHCHYGVMAFHDATHASSRLTKVNLLSGRNGHLTSHSLIFISGAILRAQFMILCDSP
jgi:hypothetical protein